MRLKKKNIGITIFAVSLVAVTAVNLHKVCKINTEYSNNIKDHQAETAVTTVIPIETEKLPTQEEIEEKQTKTIETSLVTEKEKMRKAKPVTVKEVTVKKKETTPTVTTVTQSQISENTAKKTIRETQNTRSTQDYITKNERILLCNLVGREYGSDFVPIEEKAKVVAVVMNRVRSNLFPNNIWDVIHQQGQFEDSNTSCWDLSNTYYSYQVTDSVVQAVDYYFNNTWAFDSNIMYYYGDGSYNYFY